MVEQVVDAGGVGDGQGQPLAVRRPVDGADVQAIGRDAPRRVGREVEDPEPGEMLRAVDLDPVALGGAVGLLLGCIGISAEEGDALAVGRPGDGPDIVRQGGQRRRLPARHRHQPDLAGGLALGVIGPRCRRLGLELEAGVRAARQRVPAVGQEGDPLAVRRPARGVVGAGAEDEGLGGLRSVGRDRPDGRVLGREGRHQVLDGEQDGPAVGRDLRLAHVLQAHDVGGRHRPAGVGATGLRLWRRRDQEKRGRRQQRGSQHQ